jgi:hypothetical protein
LPKPQQTGADGRFELTVPLPGGRVSLWLDARERVSRTDSFEATDKAPRDLGDIAMEPGHELHGRVVDERAMPTAGIRLRVRYVQGIVDNQSISLPTTTDPDGRFTVDRLPAGPVAFELNAPGLRLLTKDCTIEASATTDVVVRVASVPVISGVVFDPEGHPVDGVEVGVGGGKVEWPLEPVLGNARTRADGSFEITRPDDVGDEVQLQVGSFPRQYGRQRVGDPVRWGTHGLRLVATPNPTLELLARDESGRPVEEFSVFLSWNVGMYGEQTGDSSGQGHHPNGSALGYPMRRGTTAFTIIPSDRQLTCRAVLVDGDRIPAGPLAVRLETLHAFTAQVVDADDKPAAGVGVDVLELRGSSDLRSFENWRGKVQFSANGLMPLRHAGGTTDASGNVALAGTRACYDLLLVVRTKPPFTQPLTALPDDGQPLRITLPPR